MTKQLSIARDGVWAGNAILRDGSFECTAVLADDQDRCLEIYDAIETAIREGESSIEIDGHIFTWREC